MGKIAWKVINAGAVVLATAAADEALEVGWRVATGKRPPAVPENPDSRWRKLIVWAMLSGAIAGLARLVATRAAATYYEKSAGRLPTVMREALEEAEAATAPPAEVSAQA